MTYKKDGIVLTYWSTGCDISSTHVWICVCVLMNSLVCQTEIVRREMTRDNFRSFEFLCLVPEVCERREYDVWGVLGFTRKATWYLLLAFGFFCFLEKSRSKCFCQSDCTKFLELEDAFEIHGHPIACFAIFERGETFSSVNLFRFGEKSFGKAIIPKSPVYPNLVWKLEVLVSPALFSPVLVLVWIFRLRLLSSTDEVLWQWGSFCFLLALTSEVVLEWCSPGVWYDRMHILQNRSKWCIFDSFLDTWLVGGVECQRAKLKRAFSLIVELTS